MYLHIKDSVQEIIILLLTELVDLIWNMFECRGKIGIFLGFMIIIVAFKSFYPLPWNLDSADRQHYRTTNYLIRHTQEKC